MIEPFNLQMLLVNVFAGNLLLFIGLSLVVIAGLASKFKMNNMLYGVIIALYAVMIGFLANWLLFIVVLFGGLGIYFVIGKLFKQ